MPDPSNGSASLIQRTRVPLSLLDVWIPANDVSDAPRQAIRRLDVKMSKQCHSNWCWAAVAESIAYFYNPKTNCTQCVIAKKRLGRKDCCDGECGKDDDLPYNVSSTLESTLRIFGASAGIDVENMAAPLEKVQQQIQDGQPVCVRLVWSTGTARGGGHFVVISGYVPGTKRLLVLDPLGGEERDTTYETLSFAYPPHGGEWKGTYYTKRSQTPCPDDE